MEKEGSTAVEEAKRLKKAEKKQRQKEARAAAAAASAAAEAAPEAGAPVNLGAAEAGEEASSSGAWQDSADPARRMGDGSLTAAAEAASVSGQTAQELGGGEGGSSSSHGSTPSEAGASSASLRTPGVHCALHPF